MCSFCAGVSWSFEQKGELSCFPKGGKHAPDKSSIILDVPLMFSEDLTVVPTGLGVSYIVGIRHMQ